MKKVIALASIIVIAAVGVAFKSISKENTGNKVAVEKNEAKADQPVKNDISAKEHTGWD